MIHLLGEQEEEKEEEEDEEEEDEEEEDEEDEEEDASTGKEEDYTDLPQGHSLYLIDDDSDDSD